MASRGRASVPPHADGSLLAGERRASTLGIQALPWPAIRVHELRVRAGQARATQGPRRRTRVRALVVHADTLGRG